MKKTATVKTRQKRGGRGTNWTLIAIIGVIGVVALFGLLFLSLRPATAQTLADYCAESADACHSEGNPEAAVTVVEVADFGCSHCRDFHQQTWPQMVTEYIDSGLVNWVMLPYALNSGTLPVANAALCAGEQDAYFDFTNALFNDANWPTPLTDGSYVALGESLVADPDAFAACVAANRYSGVLQDNIRAAGDAGVRATPTFFINGTKVEGAYPFDYFQERITALLNG